MGIKSMKLPISFGAPNSVYFYSTEAPQVDDHDADHVESIIRGAHKESRLFFEPSTAKSIKNSSDETSHLDCVAMALESSNPYEDFKRSMEEMAAVITKGDWACLEELLAWYLSVNSKSNHAYIISAFVDLLLKISNDENSDHLNEGFSSCSASTSRKSSSSSCVSGELVLQPGKSSCFSSSSPSNSSLI